MEDLRFNVQSSTVEIRISEICSTEIAGFGLMQLIGVYKACIGGQMVFSSTMCLEKFSQQLTERIARAENSEEYRLETFKIALGLNHYAEQDLKTLISYLMVGPTWFIIDINESDMVVNANNLRLLDNVIVYKTPEMIQKGVDATLALIIYTLYIISILLIIYDVYLSSYFYYSLIIYPTLVLWGLTYLNAKEYRHAITMYKNVTRTVNEIIRFKQILRTLCCNYYE